MMARSRSVSVAVVVLAALLLPTFSARAQGPLNPPSNLVATASSDTQINLSWSDTTTNEDGFEIQRAPDTGGTPGLWAEVATVSANVTSYNDPGLSRYTTYWYRVRAYAAGWETDFSNQASARTLLLCPRLIIGWGYNSFGQATPPTNLANVVAISAGWQHSLALTSDGMVVGWGYNGNGQATPPTNLSGVVAISAADFYSLALKSDGTVVSWGLGPGTAPPASWSNVVAISAASYHALALKRDGTVTNWGSAMSLSTLSNIVAISAGSYHDLFLKRDGTVADTYGTPPSNATNLVAIAAGPTYGLALKADGTVLGWNGAPTVPTGLSNVTAIAAGQNYCLALKVDGSVVGWGSVPATVPDGLTNAIAIAAGQYHCLALTLPCPHSPPSALTATPVSFNQINLSWQDNSLDEDGFKIERAPSASGPWTQIAQVLRNTTTYRNINLMPGATWYYRVHGFNSAGDTDPSNVASATTPALGPVSVYGWGSGLSSVPTTLTGLVAIADGGNYGLALRNDGIVTGLGLSIPPTVSNVVAISANHNRSMALTSDGRVLEGGAAPLGLTVFSNAVAIAAGATHSLALKPDGTVVGWGNNSFGQTNPPAGLSGVVAIGAGDFHSLAVKSDGTVVGWGANTYGQTSPPSWLRSVVAVAGGEYHSLALRSDGTVVGWGYNQFGVTNTPAGLSGVVAIAAADLSSFALKSDGTVVGWGVPLTGTTNSPPGLTGVVAIAASYYHALAMSTAPYAPTGLAAVPTATNQINLSWTDNSSTEVRFGIEKALSSDGPWSEIASVNSNVTTCSDIVPACGPTYYYRVRAYDTLLGSPYSSVAAASSSSADTDGDGISDCWMLRYFGHPTGQTNDNSYAQADADGDGLSNLQEFLSGTDPTNNASAFRIIAVAAESNDLRVTWTTAGGHIYVVQAAPDPGSNSFVEISPYHVIPGSGDASTNYLDVGGATNTPTRLYRVRLVQ